MHDIDRTQLEASEGFGLGPPGASEFSPGEFEAGRSDGYADRAAEAGVPLGEPREMELAAELLEITNEQELEQFLGDVLRSAQGAVGRFARSDTGQALGGLLKDAMAQALPVAGRAIGQWVSPDRGGEAGARLGSAAGDLLGLELEGLSGEDREFEVARQLVRFTGAAVRQAAQAPPSVPGPVAAQTAVQQAARAYAPGLLPRLQGRSTRLWPRSGRWVRRGQAIVLFGD
jgi:hypothetical protein